MVTFLYSSMKLDLGDSRVSLKKDSDVMVLVFDLGGASFLKEEQEANKKDKKKTK